ncbi:hypothetical protein DOTSEDRAFT_148451 [Dothistroma septosporum NZE10]|uniref:Phospholipase D1 n=1 Tax=Dothistroma septosporum (strain NZE10 / CBS 128990) TaxID=675120 RepID=N1PS93_DOTSN|nr:hypothetical protein DOTSEDRAFT_148451 [Dothistroma septosporum NZE10]
MATAVVMSRDDEDLSVAENVRTFSSHGNGSMQQREGDMKTNVYTSSPLQTKPDSSIINGHHLPPAPTAPLRVNSGFKLEPPPTIQFAPPSPGAFPFNASPGSTGPSPTTSGFLPTSMRRGSDHEASPAALAGRRHPGPGAATPTERRSVQFDRGTREDAGPASLAKSAMAEGDEQQNDQVDFRGRQGSGSLFMKLRSLAHPPGGFGGHARSGSTATGVSTPIAALSPQSERSEPMYPIPTEAVESGTDADQDSSEAEQVDGLRPRRRRKSRRPGQNGGDSQQTTPRQSRFASFMREHSIAGASSGRPPTSRRATFSEAEDEGRAGLSEDEGRDKIRTAWRRGLEHARGLSYAQRNDGQEATETKRPGAFRRVTGIGGSDGNSSPFRQGAVRQQSSSAQKWRQVKAGLKMLGQRKTNERMKVDHQKSAQLMAELIAGAPAALIFASMFQRDQNEHRKVPVLLEQLKITIPEVKTKTENNDKDGDRDYIYKIDLEYGNGPARMQWTIYRSVKDFVYLHYKYKAQSAAEKTRHFIHNDKTKAKMPRFPRSVVPIARGMRGLFDKFEEDPDEADVVQPLPSGGDLDSETVANTNANRPLGHRRANSSFFAPRRQSTSDIGNTSVDPDSLTARQKELYAERSRQKLETYLQMMIRWLIFRPDSTRLCKFLELSAMAIRLSAESGYQGKQGLLQIASRRHLEMRRKIQQLGRSSAVSDFKERHKRRWFLVRHSYVVCVDGPESLVPYDVFLVDCDFAIEKPKQRILDQKTTSEMAKIAKENAKPTKKAHVIQIYNAERKLKLYAHDEKLYNQWRESLTSMMATTVWSKKQRFGSFAPVRNNVWARWLVDGRDHMWQVSRAIDNAKDFVYIHDWWLSPELYMRRPAAISQKWRLDRLLRRKAQEGVKIFVIVYRNVESAIPIDSEYTKGSLLDLHPNICVQRSPNQFRQNQFFWAHHEKLVVVDNMMAFVGGVDLCFGRWDDPCHSLTDDKLTGFELDHDVPKDSDHCQVWPGKDYSNPRVLDFYQLDRPYEEMYDRTRVPRMPWHDIAMQIVGQPARDVGRHFVQRWNYILRQRVASRPTPVLMPPPEYDQEELDRLGMTGTCQVQILRSATDWSIGTPRRTEHSIMTAYVNLIKTSEHFVYVENQFFITSCQVNNVIIHNSIGDAIVERAIRAHKDGEQWQICLVIPLMPGFQNSVDAQDGTSVRLIMQCQFRSICRGESSIFGRLQSAGIEPQDYVRFYSLRQWGKIGPQKCLTTEQLYIHAKCMVVDDRHVIIGSANINERSMLGSRDSEVASVVTDTRMIPSFMGGKPYEVGEFPHTLRKRLMREHLGVDVDAIYRREQAAAERQEQDAEMQRIYRDDHFTPSKEYFETPPQVPLPSAVNLHDSDATAPGFAGKKDGADEAAGTTKTLSRETQNLDNHAHAKKAREHELDVEGYGFDNMNQLVEAGDTGFRDTFVDEHGREVFLKQDAPDTVRIKDRQQEDLSRQRSESRERKVGPPARPPWPTERMETYHLGLPNRSTLPELPILDDTDIGGPPLKRGVSQSSKRALDTFTRSIRRPDVHEDCMTDPIAFGFYRDIWHAVAEDNTNIYRKVFHCMPDAEVKGWHEYNEWNLRNEAFMQSQGLGKSEPRKDQGAPSQSGPPGAGGTSPSSPTDGSFPDSIEKSKGLLSNLAYKLRPGTKVSKSETTHTEALREKPNHGRGSPESAGSAASSDPTAVPSSDRTTLSEKEAAKLEAWSREHNEDSPRPFPADDEKAAAQREDSEKTGEKEDDLLSKPRTVQYSDDVNHASETTATQSNPSTSLNHTASRKGRRRGTTKSSGRPPPEEVLPKEEAEELLNLIQGHLVLWPYEWLEKEERGGNWLYSIDTVAPLEIYD